MHQLLLACLSLWSKSCVLVLMEQVCVGSAPLGLRFTIPQSCIADVRRNMTSLKGLGEKSWWVSLFTTNGMVSACKAPLAMDLVYLLPRASLSVLSGLELAG